MSIKGSKQSAETINNRVLKNTGKKRTNETKLKMSKARIGKKLSEETRKKLSESHIGYKQSKEQINKRVKKLIGHKTSQETRDKISASNKGRKLSDESRIKMSIAKTGTHQSPETIEKRMINNRGEKSYNWKGGEETKKERKRFIQSRRRARKINNGGTHTTGEWELLKKQYNYTCPCCGLSEPEIKLTEDHIIPLSKGGSDLIENIQPLCLHCNLVKHTKTIKY